MKPLFSVVIPTYNRAYILLKTLDSIFQQDFSDWELLIVDDGSVDDTEALLKKTIKKDSRVRYFKQENAGASAARNHGVREARGEWVVYVDSDDEPYKNFLSLIQQCVNENLGVMYGIVNHMRHIVLMDDQRNIVAQRQPFVERETEACLQDYYHWKLKTTSTGLFHKKDIFRDGIEWDEDLKYLEDWELLLQMGRKYPDAFVRIKDIGLKYTQTYGLDGMCSAARYADWAHAFEYIYHKHKDDPLMQGQDWYPEKIEKYRRLQKLVEDGKEPEAIYKYFPEYVKK